VSFVIEGVNILPSFKIATRWNLKKEIEREKGETLEFNHLSLSK
jgi:hypothetical protein